MEYQEIVNTPDYLFRKAASFGYSLGRGTRRTGLLIESFYIRLR
jgi:hypothetical protein